MRLVDAATITRCVSGQKIARIELQAGLVGPDVERAPGRRIAQAGYLSRLRCRAAFQHPAVIVAASDVELWVLHLRGIERSPGHREIERRISNGANLAGRNAAGLDRQEVRGADFEELLACRTVPPGPARFQ